MSPHPRPRGLPSIRPGNRAGWVRDLRVAGQRHRHLLFFLLAAVVLAGWPGLGRAQRGGVSVLVADRDLAVGTVLSASDLRVATFPAQVVPTGVEHQGAPVVGRRLSGALRRGEPLTDARLLGAGLLVGLPAGEVAAPVRIADAGSVALLRPGDRVDVLATATGASSAEPTGAVHTLASAAVVLALPEAAESSASGGSAFSLSGTPTSGTAGLTDGALVVLATTPATAAALARAAVAARLSVTLVAGDGRVGG